MMNKTPVPMAKINEFKTDSFSPQYCLNMECTMFHFFLKYKGIPNIQLPQKTYLTSQQLYKLVRIKGIKPQGKPWTLI